MNKQDYITASKKLREFSHWAFIERCKGEGIIYFEGKECFIDPNQMIKRMSSSMILGLHKHPIIIAPPCINLNIFTKEHPVLKPETIGNQPCKITITYKEKVIKEF